MLILIKRSQFLTPFCVNNAEFDILRFIYFPLDKEMSVTEASIFVLQCMFEYSRRGSCSVHFLGNSQTKISSCSSNNREIAQAVQTEKKDACTS